MKIELQTFDDYLVFKREKPMPFLGMFRIVGQASYHEPPFLKDFRTIDFYSSLCPIYQLSPLVFHGIVLPRDRDPKSPPHVTRWHPYNLIPDFASINFENSLDKENSHIYLLISKLPASSTNHFNLPSCSVRFSELLLIVTKMDNHLLNPT